jgi:hypothetical protein
MLGPVAPPALLSTPVAPLAPAVENHNGENLYTCQTCPYIYHIEHKVLRRPPRPAGAHRSAAAAAAAAHLRMLAGTHPPAPWLLMQPGLLCPQITKNVPLKRKEVEPVLGGPEEWRTAPRTDGGWAGRQSGGTRRLAVCPLPAAASPPFLMSPELTIRGGLSCAAAAAAACSPLP